MPDLPIIQKTYDLIKWYIPILNRLPRDHKFMLGDRMINELYNLAWIIHEVSKKCRKESLKRFRIKLSNILIASIVP